MGNGKTPISQMNLSVRLYNSLRRAGIDTIEQLLECDESYLRGIKNLGQKSLEDLLHAVNEYKEHSGGCIPEESKDDFDIWLSDERIQQAVIEYLKHNNYRLDTLNDLSLDSYNALFFHGIEYVYEIPLMDNEKLLEIPFVDNIAAAEIRRSVKSLILIHKKDIVRAIGSKDISTAYISSVSEVLNDPDLRSSLIEFVKKYDRHIETLDLPQRAKTQLMKNGYRFASDIITLKRGELSCIDQLGDGTIERILRWQEDFLKRIEPEYRREISAKNSQELNLQSKNESESVIKLPDLQEMKNYPDFRRLIIQTVKKNDRRITALNLPQRAVNQLMRSGYNTASDIILLRREELSSLKNIGIGTIDRIIQWQNDYLKSIEPELRSAFFEDSSSLYTEDYLQRKILSLYQKNNFFRGYSLNEMREALALSDNISEELLKKAIGKLLAEHRLEYVDYRCYRLYPHIIDYVRECSLLDERTKDLLVRRLAAALLKRLPKCMI